MCATIMPNSVSAHGSAIATDQPSENCPVVNTCCAISDIVRCLVTRRRADDLFASLGPERESANGRSAGALYCFG